jgi:pyridinium-3,5-biscarboxylic acid mononucleotide synthase
MDRAKLEKLLTEVSQGRLGPEAALKKLAHFPFADLDYAKIDFHRQVRQGFPEVVFGQGKETGELEGIIARMKKEKMNVLVTRLDPARAKKLQKKFRGAEYNPRAKTFKLTMQPVKIQGKGKIAILCAGTSDLGVAEEARESAEFFGNEVEKIYDVGVAGLHRLLAHLDRIRDARVLIVVAGMEGALPSVVAGLVDKPVIGVPTSVGYGASLGGLSALFGMLNSCANSVSVVNIDNGYGAACIASLINRL